MSRYSILLVFVLFSFAVVGCFSEPEKDDGIAIVDPKGQESSTAQKTKNNQDSEEQLARPVGKEIPDDFPDDVPIADYMVCHSITRVKDNFMITFHAKDRPVAEIVEWFEAGLSKNQWKQSGTPSIGATKAILAYDKSGRNCGISISGFIVNEAFQLDETTRGILIQTPAVR